MHTFTKKRFEGRVTIIYTVGLKTGKRHRGDPGGDSGTCSTSSIQIESKWLQTERVGGLCAAVG